MSRCRLLVAIVLTIAFISLSPSFARDRSAQSPVLNANDAAWEQVKTIAQGAEVQVDVDRGSSIRGRFVEASDTALSVYVEKRRFDVDRRLIRRIYSVTHRSRSRSTLVGAGIGLGAGVGLGLVVVAVSDKSSGVNLAPVSFGFVGTIAGAAIGALSGGKRKGQLLYQRK